MKSSYLKIVFLFMAGAGLAVSCAQSETTDFHPGSGIGTGGTSSTGGTTATGATGGTTATGGTGTGGTNSTGGTTGTGGTQATGGTTGTGGVIATGGTTGTGGGSAGGSGSGGTTGGGGRSGTGGAGGGGTASFADVTALFAANCVTCHSGTNHTDLRASGLYNRIVSQNATKSCTTQKLIVPNSPSTSLISNKIKGTNLGGCGARMPYMCSTTSTNPRACLTTAQIATVDNWINAGAPM